MGGLVFLLGGVFLLCCAGETPPSRLGSILGGGMVVCLATIANWVAFGPGDRSGGATFSLPFVSLEGRAGSLAIRIAFGFGTWGQVCIIYYGGRPGRSSTNRRRG